MGEACLIKTGLGEPAENSAFVGIHGLMEDTEHHPERLPEFGRVKDRQGTGEDLGVLSLIQCLCLGHAGAAGTSLKLL